MAKPVREKVTFDENALSLQLFGPGGRHLKTVERALGIQIHSRGNELTLVGDAEQVTLAGSLLGQAYALLRRGRQMDSEDLLRAARALQEDSRADIKAIFSDTVLASGHVLVTPKGMMQKRYVDAMRSHDIVFAIGPAGTGKTYLAMATGIDALLNRQVKRIILARPAVEAGERLGFLPGDLVEKVNPYLRPLYDALNDMLPFERVQHLMDRGQIEVAPLAFMRGRTLNGSFVILDEAQNATSDQMLMFLTRLGFDSKAVVTGDVTQSDLPPDARSGLAESRDVLAGIEGIAFCEFSERDVVRHPLVQQIIRAYDARKRQMAGAEARSTGGGGQRS